MSPPGGPPGRAADRVVIGALIRERSRQPLLDSAELWRVVGERYDGQVEAALGELVARLAEVERGLARIDEASS